MTDFNFSETHKKAEKEYNLGKGEYFKVSEGANNVRLVSICLPHQSTYKGQPTFKWLCQVIDRNDGKVKPYFMPDTIYKSIEALQLNPDFGFESVPMPYDLVINAKNAGVKEVVYNVMPSKEKPLSSEDQEALKEAPSVEELQKKVRENEGNRKEEPKPSEDDVTIDPEEIDL